MDKKAQQQEAMREWGKRFLPLAHQLNQPWHGVSWFLMGVSPEDAAAWANLGLLPAEAAPHIDAGITPAMYREMEEYAEQQAGGPDELAAQRIRQMIDAGEIVDPARVVRVQDPTDPTREIIALRDEQ